MPFQKGHKPYPRKKPLKTQERRQNKARLQFMLEATKGLDLSTLAVDHLAACLDFYARMCSFDQKNMADWMDKRMACAAKLAPYQSPTFQAIQVTGNQQDQAKLAKMSDAELAIALKERAESLGMVVKVQSSLEYKAKGYGRGIDDEILEHGPAVKDEGEG